MPPTLEERFLAKVRRDDKPAPYGLSVPCLLWTGATIGKAGYGEIIFEGKKTYAHRVAFFLALGRWPEPKAAHLCRVRGCCEISHLIDGGPVSGAKLSARQVRAIRSCYVRGKSRAALAKRFGVSTRTIDSIILRETWKHLA